MGGCCQRESTDSRSKSAQMKRSGTGETSKTGATTDEVASPPKTKAKRQTATDAVSKTGRRASRSEQGSNVSKTPRTPRTPRSPGGSKSLRFKALSKQRSNPPETLSHPTKKLSRPFDEIYNLKGEVLRDSFGSLWLISHRKTQLMRLARLVERTDEAVAGIAAEVNALDKVDHSNILKFSEILESDTHYFILFEAVVGSRVVQYSEIAGKITEITLGSIAMQLLQALKICHSKEILHKSLNFRNVLFLETKSKEIFVKLVGMGANRKISTETDTSADGSLAFCAPEVFRGKNTDKTDVWACGVLLYYLVGNQLPFHSHSKEELRYELEQSCPSFPLGLWGGFSLELQQLLESMLTQDQEERASLAQCIAHPWVRQYYFSNTGDAVKSALVNLKNFRGGKKLKLAVVNFLAENVIPSDIRAKLMKAFNVIDVNSENVISKEELISAFRQYYTEKDSISFATRVIEAVDQDGNGQLTSSEFILAALDERMILAEESLQQSFEILDKDNSGSVHLTELMAALKCSDEDWKELLMKVDSDGDGEMNFAEFSHLMHLAVE